MAFELPELPYALDALEPALSKEVVDTHYNKHTKKYYDNVNKDIKGTLFDEMSTIDDAIKRTFKYSTNSTLLFNLGQAWNHTFFWENLSPNETKPSDELMEEIEIRFDSFDEFKEAFINTGVKGVGSMWTWLFKTSGGLNIHNTPNGMCPVADTTRTPLLVIDGWEHAYYLQYPADKEAYYRAVWDLINWELVNDRFRRAA